jgi:multiple sugar transport system permease protein
MAQAVQYRRPWLHPNRVLLYLVLLLITLFFVIPLLWMVSTAFKDELAIYTDPGFIPKNATLDNFKFVLTASGDTPVFRWLLNSILVASVGTALTVLLTSLSAYAFARMDFRFKNFLFSFLIATLLLPSVMFLVPQFVIIAGVGLYNTLPAIMLPGLAGVFGVFFMRQFFLGIPTELEEAAYVDGANRLKIFWSIILPLSGPALATLAVISFLGFWNDYLWPIIVCQGPGCTLPPGLRNFQGQYAAKYGLLMAGALLAAVPMIAVYIFAQRFIIQSVTSSGIKG